MLVGRHPAAVVVEQPPVLLQQIPTVGVHTFVVAHVEPMVWNVLVPVQPLGSVRVQVPVVEQQAPTRFD